MMSVSEQFQYVADGDRHAKRGCQFMFLLLVVVAMASPMSAEEFFDGPTAIPGDPMFFSIYSILPSQNGNANMQKVADGGFTAAGPYYGTSGDPTIDPTGFYTRVNQAATHGLKYIAHMPNHPDVINDTSGFIRGDSMAAIPEADLRQFVRDVMDFTLDDPTANATVSAWYTNPEELRPWRGDEMDYLHIVVDEIKNYDPLGRPVSMYNPRNRMSSQLEAVVSQGLDSTMMGVYITDLPFATRGAGAADGLNRILTAASNTSTLPVAVFQLSQDFDSSDVFGLRNALGGVSTTRAIEQVIRHDVYQGLLRGTRGVQVWSGCDCRTGLSTYTAQLDGYISVSQDLNGDLNLSDVFLQGEARTDFEATVLAGPTTVTHESTTVDTITLADIAYGDSRYLFLANSSNSPLSISIDGLPPGILRTQIDDLFANAPELSVDSNTGQMLLNMEPLEVIALAVRVVDGTPGDYNGDGIVNVADYTVWRDNLGAAAGTLMNDPNTSLVGSAQYSTWKASFGSNLPAPGSLHGTHVPEPATCISLLLGALAGLSCHRRAACGSIRPVSALPANGLLGDRKPSQ